MLSPRSLKAALDEKPLVGQQMALLTIIGFWIFHAAIVSLRSAVMAFPAQGELAARRIVVTVLGILLTWMLYLVLRLVDRKPLNIRVATAFLAAIPCAFAIGWINYYVFNVFDPVSMFEDPNVGRRVEEVHDLLGITAFQDIAEIAVTRYFFLIAWALLYLALGYAREVSETEKLASRYAQAAQDAELRSLRYQVNPHFLFNTLNSLSSLVIKGRTDQAEAMIQNLSTFYRASLTSDPIEEVSLAEEIALQEQYLAIEKIRFPDRLQTILDIDPALSDFPVPALILQPLVENAIKHGVSQTNQPVTISISAHQIADSIHISIADDSKANQIASHGDGIGLNNVRDRLVARYGNAAALKTTFGIEGGFTACLHLPKIAKAA